jgi:hypothetical protein
MYMRTGSVVRPASESSAESAATGFLGDGLVIAGGGRGRVGHEQGLGIRRNLVHLDAHVIDHADDVFDLFRIDNVVRKVVVDFGVGQVALFAALDDELLDFGLLFLILDRHDPGAW